MHSEWRGSMLPRWPDAYAYTAVPLATASSYGVGAWVWGVFAAGERMGVLWLQQGGVQAACVLGDVCICEKSVCRLLQATATTR